MIEVLIKLRRTSFHIRFDPLKKRWNSNFLLWVTFWWNKRYISEDVSEAAELSHRGSTDDSGLPTSSTFFRAIASSRPLDRNTIHSSFSRSSKRHWWVLMHELMESAFGPCVRCSESSSSKKAQRCLVREEADFGLFPRRTTTRLFDPYWLVYSHL